MERVAGMERVVVRRVVRARMMLEDLILAVFVLIVLLEFGIRIGLGLGDRLKG
jgi:hypothetical protein